jgi:hypothetical protein
MKTRAKTLEDLAKRFDGLSQRSATMRWLDDEVPMRPPTEYWANAAKVTRIFAEQQGTWRARWRTRKAAKLATKLVNTPWT